MDRRTLHAIFFSAAKKSFLSKQKKKKHTEDQERKNNNNLYLFFWKIFCHCGNKPTITGGFYIIFIVSSF